MSLTKSRNRKSGERINKLLELGRLGSVDATKLSPSTISCMLSHIRLLERNDIIISRNTLVGDTKKILDSLTDSRGQRLSLQYKRQILMTIKRMYPSDNIDTGMYRDSRIARNKTRLSDNNFVEKIKNIVDRASYIVGEVYKNKGIDDLSMYDTCLCVLITCMTSLRIHEIRELKMSHINHLRQGIPLSIHTKGRSSLRTVTYSENLEMVLNAIELQRAYVEININDRVSDAKYTQIQRERLLQDYIIITSDDFMRKKLREIAASLSLFVETLGFNVFRKYIVTVLVDKGGHEIAQSLNNHASVNTTLEHYNVMSSKAAEKTYNAVNRVMKELVPNPPKNLESEQRKIENQRRRLQYDEPESPPKAKIRRIEDASPQTKEPGPSQRETTSLESLDVNSESDEPDEVESVAARIAREPVRETDLASGTSVPGPGAPGYVGDTPPYTPRPPREWKVIDTIIEENV